MRRTLTFGLLVLALTIASLAARGPLVTSRAFAASPPPVFLVTSDELYIRAAPSTTAAVVGTLTYAQPVAVWGWTSGQVLIGKNNVWAEVGPGQYVYTAYLYREKPAVPPVPPDIAPWQGRWIDLNLTQQVITAYEGSRPVYWALASTGGPGWETPTGVFRIQRRVANETMDSRTLDVASDPYRLEDVLYTQYFTRSGHAIHGNYWKWDSPWGVPTSHGCAGLPDFEALVFWRFATVGTPIVSHY